MRVNTPASFGPGMGPLALQQRSNAYRTVPLTHGAPVAWRPVPAPGGQLGQVGGFLDYWMALGVASDLLRL